jgi:putative addiction module component (TIGR02574 family)
MHEDVSDADERVRRVVAQFLELSVLEREEALDLMHYAVADSPMAVEEAWRVEIERRARGMEDGTRTAVPWSEARKQLGWE